MHRADCQTNTERKGLLSWLIVGREQIGLVVAGRLLERVTCGLSREQPRQGAQHVVRLSINVGVGSPRTLRSRRLSKP